MDKEVGAVAGRGERGRRSADENTYPQLPKVHVMVVLMVMMISFFCHVREMAGGKKEGGRSARDWRRTLVRKEWAYPFLSSRYSVLKCAESEEGTTGELSPAEGS